MSSENRGCKEDVIGRRMGRLCDTWRHSYGARGRMRATDNMDQQVRPVPVLLPIAQWRSSLPEWLSEREQWRAGKHGMWPLADSPARAAERYKGKNGNARPFCQRQQTGSVKQLKNKKEPLSCPGQLRLATKTRHTSLPAATSLTEHHMQILFNAENLKTM